MGNTDKTIIITWRDENYGPINGAVAFRAMIEPMPSETAKKKIVKAYKDAGFELHFNRQVWIAQDDIETAPTALVENLENMGYEITNCGRTPANLEEAKPATPTGVAPSI